ncbi:MAG TPA: class I SAM-dependent methyltransferase [Polyangiaceae bacterium]|nr:class I SAM-dependent methyltransferase [Polyangiaceae bacterium]
MFKEIGHFIKTGKTVSALQKELPRAEFADTMMKRVDEQGFADIRRELVGDLEGRVLDLGCGTGSMFEYFGPRAQVEAIEPEEDFLALAKEKAAKSAGRVRAGAGSGMELPFPDRSFDAVVFGLVLCSVPSVERVLAEAHRVLRPGGELRALEHVRSEAPVAGFLMDVGNPLWLRLNKQGCCWNRDPLPAVEAAGFQVDDVMAFKRFDLLMPAFPMRRIKGRRPRS